MNDVIPRFKWKIIVYEGAEIPRGYGIAYYLNGARGAAAMPLPLNLIVGAWRAFVWSLRCPPWRMVEYRAEHVSRSLDQTYQRGVVDGWAAHGGHPNNAPQLPR